MALRQASSKGVRQAHPSSTQHSGRHRHRQALRRFACGRRQNHFSLPELLHSRDFRKSILIDIWHFGDCAERHWRGHEHLGLHPSGCARHPTYERGRKVFYRAKQRLTQVFVGKLPGWLTSCYVWMTDQPQQRLKFCMDNLKLEQLRSYLPDSASAAPGFDRFYRFSIG